MGLQLFRQNEDPNLFVYFLVMEFFCRGKETETTHILKRRARFNIYKLTLAQTGILNFLSIAF